MIFKISQINLNLVSFCSIYGISLLIVNIALKFATKDTSLTPSQLEISKTNLFTSFSSFKTMSKVNFNDVLSLDGSEFNRVETITEND